jgi:hypothetical protein
MSRWRPIRVLLSDPTRLSNTKLVFNCVASVQRPSQPTSESSSTSSAGQPPSSSSIGRAVQTACCLARSSSDEHCQNDGVGNATGSTRTGVHQAMEAVGRRPPCRFQRVLGRSSGDDPEVLRGLRTSNPIIPSGKIGAEAEERGAGWGSGGARGLNSGQGRKHRIGARGAENREPKGEGTCPRCT